MACCQTYVILRNRYSKIISMKKYSITTEKFTSFYEGQDNPENDDYIEDLTKIEEDNPYDLYNFFPDAAF